MNEECFQIISGIVYPRIGFVARKYSARRFGSFACAERHSPKKARNYPCNRAKPVSSHPRQRSKDPSVSIQLVAKYGVPCKRERVLHDIPPLPPPPFFITRETKNFYDRKTGFRFGESGFNPDENAIWRTSDLIYLNYFIWTWN